MTLDEALHLKLTFLFKYEEQVIIGTVLDCRVVTGLYSAMPDGAQINGDILARRMNIPDHPNCAQWVQERAL